MSSRPTRAFALFLICLLMPAAASAQIGRGWLERLSGPGPFTGLTLEARLLCLTTGEYARSAASEIRSVLDQDPGGRVTVELGRTGRAWFAPASCQFLPAPDQPRFEIGLHYSGMSSSDNVLNYSDRPGLSQKDLEIKVRTFMVTADIRVNRVLDVGAAVGRARFSSGGNLFSDFTRTVYQPMRLTTRPIVAFWTHPAARLLLVQFDGTRFKDGFTAEDFGAVPGTYNDPGEMNWTWSIKLDLATLLWR